MEARRRTTAIGLILAAAVALFLPAADAGSGPIDVSILSDRGRRWVGEGVVGDPNDQTATRLMKPGSDAYMTVRLANISKRRKTFRVTGSSSNDYFDVTYMDDDVDVTAAVTGDGYEMSMGGRGEEYLYAEVEASEDAPTRESIDLDISAEDVASDATDEVRAHFEIAPLRLWAVTRDGRLRCDAIFDDRVLTPGYETGVRLKITNLTDERIENAPFEGSLVFRDEEGNELWDSTFDGGRLFPNELAPHETKRMSVIDARVRWSGPLKVRPRCGDLRLRMPAATFEVSSPGAPASEEEAIHIAASRPGSPFADCEPEDTETPGYTTLTPPDGRDEPAMPVRCSAEVRHEDGFDVVALNMVYPDDEEDFVIPESSGNFFSFELPGEGNFYAGRWSFVVTDQRARPYISLSTARGVGDGRAYSYSLEDGEWSMGGWSRCGFEGYTLYFAGTGFNLDWVASCDESSSNSDRSAPKRTVTNERVTVRR